MFIDVTIYGDDGKYLYGYYNEDANIDSLKEIITNLRYVIDEKRGDFYVGNMTKDEYLRPEEQTSAIDSTIANK